VIPGVMGLCFFSPRVEESVSVKGYEMAKRVSNRFSFHRFGACLPGLGQALHLKDATLHHGEKAQIHLSLLAEHASNGDLFGVVNLVNMVSSD